MLRLYVRNGKIRNIFGQVFLSGCNVRGQAYNPDTSVGYGWKGTGFDDPFTWREIDSDIIRNYGLNCVRTGGVYWALLEISPSPSEFVVESEYLEAIKQFVKTYTSKGIYVILSLMLHGSINGMAPLANFLPLSDKKITDSFFTDIGPTSGREHLKNMWLALSEAFKNEWGIAGYDIMNEPGTYYSGNLTVQELNDYWQEIVDYVTLSLRENGDRHIIMPCMAPWARSCKTLSSPFKDPNTLYEPHVYQGTDSAGNILTTNIDELRSQVYDDIGLKMTNFNTPWISGEFGNLGSIDNAQKEEYLKNLLTVLFEHPNYGGALYWAYYSYDGVPTTSGWYEIMNEYVPTPTSPLITVLSSVVKYLGPIGVGIYMIGGRRRG